MLINVIPFNSAAAGYSEGQKFVQRSLILGDKPHASLPLSLLHTLSFITLKRRPKPLQDESQDTPNSCVSVAADDAQHAPG